MSVIGWFVLGFAALGLAAIVFVPKIIIPTSRSGHYDEVLRVATTRNSISGTIAQIVAGLAFVATFIQGSVNFSSEYKQKSDLATADQFAKAFSQLKDSSDNTLPSGASISSRTWLKATVAIASRFMLQ